MTTKKLKSKDTAITVAIISAIATVIVALIGVMSVWLNRQTTTTTSTTTTTIASEPSLLFMDTFEDTKKGWNSGDFLESSVFINLRVGDGKFYRLTKTQQESNGYWGTTEIPKVFEKNFCLIFDARISDFSGNFGIVVVARATNYGDSEARSNYRIQLSDDEKGIIFVNESGAGNERQIGEFNNSTSWSDKKTHTIKISLQDNILEIYDGQANILMEKLSISDDNLLSNAGEIRLGTEIFKPNQQATAEFDNVFVYSVCP